MKDKGNTLFFIILVIAVIAIGVVVYLFAFHNKTSLARQKQLTWDECVKTPGALLQETYPAKCTSPDKRSVVQPLANDQKKNLVPPADTTDKVDSLKYSIPKGWITVQDKSNIFEISYDPKTGKNASVDSGIRIAEIEGKSQLFTIGIHSYDGGSRHKFILNGATSVAEGDKMPGFFEKAYEYNGWSCYIIYGVSISQWPTTLGMCVISNTKAFSFGTWYDEEKTLMMLQTLKLL